ncbi:MAG TPA: AmmeMemoRadiSam system protein B [Terriglobia bacterium]|nr:AmmeMemoRadiSam system protein B [Terriglobia bacterium]
MIREPAVAGRFYPAKPDDLLKAIQSYVQPDDPRTQVIGIVAPHAGYMYSGHVAGAVYSRIQVPSRNVILCPNHTGLGTPLSIMRSGAWQTPLGDMQIDQELCESLMAADSHLEDDAEAHRYEHALEVHLPFIQHVAGASATFAPITVGTANWQRLEELGRAIGEVLQKIDRTALIIASSDMNHYESDAVTRVKDHKAIDQVLAMDPRGLYDVVRSENISMCGYGPTVAMLVAARMLGASKAELVKYATSGDVSLDFDRVVGYAGMVVF